MSVKIHVAETRPEEEPEALAVQLAESMHNMMQAQQDADAYQKQSISERAKAGDCSRALAELDERARNPPTKISRMDRIATYDREMIVAEKKKSLERAQDFQQRADNYNARVNTLRRATANLHVQISNATAKRKRVRAELAALQAN